MNRLLIASFVVLAGVVDAEPTFTLKQGERLVSHAANAYCKTEADFHKYNKGTVVENFNLVQYEHDNDTREISFIGYDTENKEIIISFKGTSFTPDLKNFMIDATASLVQFPGLEEGILVHKGFLNTYYHKLYSMIRDNVVKLQARFPDYNIITTGHSLGGALAVICATDLYLQGFQAQSFTFGQPRVGNHAFVHWYKQNLPDAIRVTNSNDIIPHLPPVDLTEYKHFSTEVYQEFGELDNITVCRGNEDMACSLKDKPSIAFGIMDHLFYLNIRVNCYKQVGLKPFAKHMGHYLPFFKKPTSTSDLKIQLTPQIQEEIGVPVLTPETITKLENIFNISTPYTTHNQQNNFSQESSYNQQNNFVLYSAMGLGGFLALSLSVSAFVLVRRKTKQMEYSPL